MQKHLDHFNRHQRIRFMRPDAARWLRPPHPDERKFDPNQPRDEDGKWTDGGGGSADADAPNNPLVQLANVIRICILSGVARSTAGFGKEFTAYYDCANGSTLKRVGWGHRVPGFIADPH